jgi:phosphatidylserine synthase
MKKDLIFTPAMLIVGALLFLLKATGMIAHIAISVIGVLVLVAYTVLTKKDWKIPALEIIMRAFYGIALITGVVIMNLHGIAALAIIHKASAVLFMVLIIVLLANKVATNKKA